MAAIGTGVIVIIAIWAVVFIIAIAFAQVNGILKIMAPVMIIVGVIITVILIFIPRTPVSTDVVIYDYYLIARVTILVFVTLMSLVGSLFFGLSHAFQKQLSMTASAQRRVHKTAAK